MTDATQLLRDYAELGSEPAFRELVGRYTDLVYSVALRRMGGDRHRAEDIVQKVFTDLAIQSRRGRGPLAGGPCALGGWLHRHTCFVAANLHRADQRRQVREQLAVEMNSLDSAPDASWQQLAPVLDETLNELEPCDRDALLLRFYERRDLREIGVALGVSEDAAQKRVARALDKLRGLLAARGVALGAAGLAGLLTEGTVQAAPSALAGRASEAACAAAAVGVGSGLLGWLLATTQAKLAAGLVVAGLIALPLWWHAGSRNPAGDGTAGEVGGSASLAAPAVESGAQHEAAVASAWTFARPALSEVDPDALTLTFVTADTGSPVPNVAVDYWCRHGESVDRRTLHGTRLGVCEVRFPRHSATELRLTSQCEGFADTRLEWRPDRGEAIPFEYTLRLERAVPIGGTVVNPDGQPVAGARVSFGHSHHDNREAGRPQNHLFSSIQVETDGNGRWQVNHIAEEMIRRISSSAKHPDFVRSESVEVARDSAAEQRLRAGQYVFQLRQGVTVRGVVVDDAGQPVPDATVRVGWISEAHTREIRTFADGSFEVAGCQPGRKPVAAEAAGFASTTIEADIHEATPPLRLVLQPGKALRFRVVDKVGLPVTGARFVLETIEARHLEHTAHTVVPNIAFRGLTDAEGRAVWETAPDQDLSFAISKTGYMRQNNVPMRPGEQEHVVVLQPALTITGTVSDASTGELISNFRILCGWPEAFRGEQRRGWSSIDRHQLTFSGGTFRHSLEEGISGGIPNPGYLFKFEAEGYASYVTRVFSPDEGEVEFAVALRPAETVTVTVLLPNGQPATRCDMGFISPGARITLLPGGLDRRLGGVGVTTDAAGQFRLPADDEATTVVAAHPHGFAMASRAALEAEPVLLLQAWARVEGRIWSRGKPAAGRELDLDNLHMTHEGPFQALRLDGSNFRRISDANGEFVFEQVPPIDLRLVELVPIETPPPQSAQGHSLSFLKTIQPPPGQTAFVEIGQDTLAVRLRLRWPDGAMSPVNDRVAFAWIDTPIPRLPAETHFSRSAVTHSWRLTQAPDGAWEAEDVIPGHYVVRAALVRASNDGADQPQPRQFEASVVIPAEGEGGMVDLGEVALQPPSDAEGSSVRPFVSVDDFRRCRAEEPVDCLVAGSIAAIAAGFRGSPRSGIGR